MPKILFVDNKQYSRDQINDLLSKRGFEITFADHPEQASSMLSDDEARFQAVITSDNSRDPIRYTPNCVDTPPPLLIDLVDESVKKDLLEMAQEEFKLNAFSVNRNVHIDTLLSLIRLSDADPESLITSFVEQPNFLQCLEKASFQFRTIQETQLLAKAISAVSPNPRLVELGLSELMLNAIEHGNLRIGYHEKSMLQKQGLWEKEIIKRMTIPENQLLHATLTFAKDRDEYSYTITDMGDGFDWKKYEGVDDLRMFDTHGRGISIAKSLCFDSVQYSDKGNTVTCTIKLN